MSTDRRGQFPDTARRLRAVRLFVMEEQGKTGRKANLRAFWKHLRLSGSYNKWNNYERGYRVHEESLQEIESKVEGVTLAWLRHGPEKVKTLSFRVARVLEIEAELLAAEGAETLKIAPTPSASTSARKKASLPA